MESRVGLVKSTTHKQRRNLLRVLGYVPTTYRLPHAVTGVRGDVCWGKDSYYHEWSHAEWRKHYPAYTDEQIDALIKKG